MNHNTHLFVLVTSVLWLALFSMWPELDLLVSTWAGGLEGFPLGSLTLVRAIHDFAAPLTDALIAFLAIWVLLQVVQRYRARTGGLGAYLLVALLAGPVVTVNYVIKNESGRPRPNDTVIYGGSESFVEAFSFDGSCQRNCSFVSGHAALGFMLGAPFFATGRRRWLWLGIGGGALLGASRIVAGKHFLSDVVFAFYIVYLVNLLTWHALGWWRLRTPQGPPTPQTESAVEVERAR